jgi:hypothetical protein
MHHMKAARLSVIGVFLASANQPIAQSRASLPPLKLPPQASSRIALDRYEDSPLPASCRLADGTNATKRTQIDDEAALRQAGYTEVGWYLLGSNGFFNGEDTRDASGVKGFAFVTKTEQIDDDGKHVPDPYRWNTSDIYPPLLQRRVWWKRIAWGPPNIRLRVFLFWVVATSDRMQQGQQKLDEKISPNEWEQYIAGGAKEPPKVLTDFKHAETASFVYAYEYERSNVDGKFLQLRSDVGGQNRAAHSTKSHLKDSGLWDALCLPND